MDYTQFVHAQSLLKDQSLSLDHPTYKPPVAIQGVLEIADKFDVFLFSINDTLMCGEQTMPSAAITIPALRRMSKRIGVFCLDDTVRKRDLLKRANRFGFSVGPAEILKRSDFDEWEDAFPLALPYRTLMICSDPVGEISLARYLGMPSLLVTKHHHRDPIRLNVTANYYSLRV